MTFMRATVLTADATDPIGGRRTELQGRPHRARVTSVTASARPLIDYSRAYHQGVRVPNLEAAMAELGPALGITWCSIQEREQAAWVPGAGTVKIPLRFTYSTEGPQHVKLLEGAPGTIWDGGVEPGLHHMGVWSDDVGGDTQRALDAGWTLGIAQLAPEKGFGAFTYVRPASSKMLLELVSSQLQPMFERWWAGGPLG